MKGPLRLPRSREAVGEQEEPREALPSGAEVASPPYGGWRPTWKEATERNTDCSALQPTVYVRLLREMCHKAVKMGTIFMTVCRGNRTQ